MGNRREYDIAFVGLKPGVHEYNYEVDDKFFSEFKEVDFDHCSATVKLSLEKNTSFMMLKFEIGGSLKVECDRCGNNLPIQLWDEFNLIIKQVENPEEMNDNEEDPDVYYISRSESHLHLAEWIYEFVMLSIPMQRRCGEDEVGGSQCNKEILELLEQMQQRVQSSQPLQKGLQQFKKNNN